MIEINMNDQNKIFYYLDKIVLVSISILLILICTFKPLGFDKDSYNYLFDLNNVETASITREYSFYLIATFINKFFDGDILYLFLIYALISIPIKIYVIDRININKYYGLFIYLILFFMIQELTQIRVGVSIAFFMLAYLNLLRDKIYLSIFNIVLSIFFHYQAIFAFFIILFHKLSIKKCLYILIISILISILFKNNLFEYVFYVLENLGLNVLVQKISIYSMNSDSDKVAKLGLFQLFIFLILILYLYLYFKLGLKGRNCIDEINIKLLILCLTMYFLLSFNGTIALRVFEYFSVILIFVIPSIFRFFSPAFLIKIGFSFFLFFYFFNAVYDKFNFNLYGW